MSHDSAIQHRPLDVEPEWVDGKECLGHEQLDGFDWETYHCDGSCVA